MTVVLPVIPQKSNPEGFFFLSYTHFRLSSPPKSTVLPKVQIPLFYGSPNSDENIKSNTIILASVSPVVSLPGGKGIGGLHA